MVKYQHIDLKEDLNKEERKKILLTEIPKLEVQEGFSIITLPDGSKKIFEVVEGQAKERTDLRV